MFVSRRQVLSGIATTPLLRGFAVAANLPTLRVESRTIEVLGKAVSVFSVNGPNVTEILPDFPADCCRFHFATNGSDLTKSNWISCCYTLMSIRRFAGGNVSYWAGDVPSIVEG